MNEIFTDIFQTIINVLKLLILTFMVGVLICNLLFIINVAKLVRDMDIKTDVMGEAFKEYHKITIESMKLMLQSQLGTNESVKELENYVAEQSTIIEKEINDKTVLPNFMDLVKSNVIVMNDTKNIAGSGTIIKVDGKYYILSAGHLDDPTDTFYVNEKGEMRLIQLVKVNHKIDLSLFEYVGDYDDLTSAKIADKEPDIGDKVWAIGNPAMLEDAITSGSLVRKRGFSYLIDAKIYYGSSGGGLFNTKGELIGVNVAMVGVQDYVLGLSVNLRTIKAFIKGQIASEI